MTVLFSNNSSTTLSSGISPSDTSLTVSAGTGAEFPSPSGADYFIMTLQDSANADLTEIVHVTGRITDTMTIVRAQEGTSAQSWTSGDFAFSGPTKGMMELFPQVPVVNADLDQMAGGTVKANITGSSAAPSDVPLADFADALPLPIVAFVNFQGRSTNGACTILKSLNVSGVTRNSAGNYTVTFSTPLADAEYLPNITCTGQNNVGCVYPEAAQIAGSCQFWIQHGNGNIGSAAEDPTRVYITFTA